MRLDGEPLDGHFVTTLTHAEVQTLIDALKVSQSARLRRIARGELAEIKRLRDAIDLYWRLREEVTIAMLLDEIEVQ